MLRITKIVARQVFDSRGFPTVEVELSSKENSAIAIVPSGKSTGEKEALELRDNDKEKWNGKGIEKAISNINNIIAPKLLKKDFLNQEELDNFLIDLDGTDNKSNLGANSILAISLAFSKLVAKENRIELWEYFNKIINLKENPSLPLPMLNVINGGSHADNNIDFQEYMIIAIGAKTFEEALLISGTIFHKLENLLNEKSLNTNKGDEGGYAPKLANNEEPLKLLLNAITKSGYKLGKDVALGLDVAASEFYNPKLNKYYLSAENKYLTTQELLEYYDKLIKKYSLISLEDPFSENDILGFQLLTKKYGKSVQIVGDDLLVTNYKLLEQAIVNNTCNAILIKPNQIGTVSETIKTIKLAKEHNYNVIISHRSGETEDTSIADLAVGVNAKQIKTGSFSRSERIAKYNRLIRISETVKKFYGGEIFNF